MKDWETPNVLSTIRRMIADYAMWGVDSLAKQVIEEFQEPKEQENAPLFQLHVRWSTNGHGTPVELGCSKISTLGAGAVGEESMVAIMMSLLLDPWPVSQMEDVLRCRPADPGCICACSICQAWSQQKLSAWT